MNNSNTTKSVSPLGFPADDRPARTKAPKWKVSTNPTNQESSKRATTSAKSNSKSWLVLFLFFCALFCSSSLYLSLSPFVHFIMHAQIELSYKVSQPTIRRRRRRRMYVCCAVRCDTISFSISQEEWRERFVGWNGTQKRARTTRDFCCSAFILMQISHNNYENNGCACLSAFLVCHRRRVELFLEKEVFAKSEGWRTAKSVCVCLPFLLFCVSDEHSWCRLPEPAAVIVGEQKTCISSLFRSLVSVVAAAE